MDRSCYECQNMSLCYIFRSLAKIITGEAMNIDSDGAPGQVSDIYKATANCCLRFNQRKEAINNRYDVH